MTGPRKTSGRSAPIYPAARTAGLLLLALLCGACRDTIEPGSEAVGCRGDEDYADIGEHGYSFNWSGGDCEPGTFCEFPHPDSLGNVSTANTNFDPNLGLLVLGPEDGPDKEPQAGLTLTFDEPIQQTGLSWCFAEVTWAALATTDVRVGTGDEINGKFYELYEGANQCGSLLGAPNQTATATVRVDYISRDVISGTACLGMQRVIYSPVAPPVYAEVITVVATFTVINPSGW